MTPRQHLALTRILNDTATPLPAELTVTRRDRATGLIIQSLLAVDR